jgi:hypothetical protein
MLLEERICSLRRREFRRVAKALYWGKAVSPPVAASDLSRALSRLEERGLIERFAGGWRLTCPDTDLVRNGYIDALCVWGQKKDLYLQLGLKGPDPKSWSPSDRPGVKVQLHF